MIKYKPITHLSTKSYYNRKRWQLVFIIFAVITAIYLLFNFGGKNFKYYFLIKSAVNNFKKGKINYAISDFNKAINLNSKNPLAYDGLGSIYLKQGDFEKAKNYFDQALNYGLKFNSTINHIEYGNTYLNAGLYNQAELEFTQAIKLYPTDSKALFGLACCYHAQLKLDSAIMYYNKALTYNPKFIAARKGLAMAEDDKNKGAIYYIFDRNGEPLARYNLIELKNKRTYLLDSKTAHILGYVDEKRNKKQGLEKFLENYIPGNKIYLTIDSKIQKAVVDAMGWRKGSFVVLNPKTGEILAIYNQPTFSPNNLNDPSYYYKIIANKNKPFLNRAFEKLYEPGSIAKIITLSAFFDTGLSEKNIFPVKCSGSTVFNNKPFWCWKKHGKVKSIEEAIEESCNMGSAFMGFAIGSPKLSEYNTKFAFNEEFDLGFFDALRNQKISIPVLKSLNPENDIDKYELAMHASGLSPDKTKLYRITPLHAALLSATIANKGVMMYPYLIKEIRNINGKLIYASQPKLLKIATSPTTAEKIKNLMVLTVEKGIGQKAKVKGLKIAGKTGTSGGEKNGLNAWFLAFAPADDPQFAVAILGDEEGKGMQVAAPIAADFFKALLK